MKPGVAKPTDRAEASERANDCNGEAGSRCDNSKTEAASPTRPKLRVIVKSPAFTEAGASKLTSICTKLCTDEANPKDDTFMANTTTSA